MKKIIKLINKGFDKIYVVNVSEGIFYKAFLFTERGVIKLDTCSQSVITKDRARRIIKHNKMVEINIEALIKNWKKYGLWESRVIEKTIVEGKL